MQKTGIIYNVDLENKIFSIENGKRLQFFYIANNQMKKFKKYLYKGNLVSFVYNEKMIINKNGYMPYQIDYFKEISVPGRRGMDVLYSKRDTSLELKSFINDLDNLLFIDIEMSMPGYDDHDFLSEIIQAGMFVVDKNGNKLCEYNYHILPTVNKFLSKRTEDFLNITYDELLSKGVEYNKFYDCFKELLNKYNPAVVVFGKNDKLFLESSYKTNKEESLNSKIRFVNLNQLLKNFYELSNDPGLFKMYERLYGKKAEPQKHDALEDALYTYYVFEAFKNDLNK